MSKQEQSSPEYKGLPIATAYNLSDTYSLSNEKIFQASEFWTNGLIAVWQDDKARFARLKSLEIEQVTESQVKGWEIMNWLQSVPELDQVPVTMQEIVKTEDQTYIRFEGSEISLWIDGSLLRLVMRKSKNNLSWRQNSLDATEFCAVRMMGHSWALVTKQHGEVKNLIAPIVLNKKSLEEIRGAAVMTVGHDPEAEPTSPEELQALREHVEEQQAQRLQAYRAMLAKQQAQNTAAYEAARLSQPLLGQEPRKSVREILAQLIHESVKPEPQPEDPEALPASFAGILEPRVPALPAPSPILLDIEQSGPGTAFQFVRHDLDMSVTVMPYWGEIELLDPDGNLEDIMVGAHPELFYLIGSDLEERGSYVIQDLGLVVYDLLDHGFTVKPQAPAARYDEGLQPLEESEELDELVMMAA